MQKGHCIHFTGIQHDFCKAAIRYSSVLGNNKIPCFEGVGSTCDKYQDPSDAQIKADEKAYAAALDRMDKVVPLINRIRKEHRGQSWQGVETCPACGGRLHLAIAAYNGHMRGQCETKDCVAWIE